MSSDAWKERGKAVEDQYFEKMNQEAVSRMKERRALKSPVSGELMEQVTVMGVNIDRCLQTGGVWLDGGELEAIIKAAKGSDGPKSTDWASSFVGSLFKPK